ncbi:hypothetical protein Tco_0396908 [Tanacetum coccineum]
MQSLKIRSCNKQRYINGNQWKKQKLLHRYSPPMVVEKDYESRKDSYTPGTFEANPMASYMEIHPNGPTPHPIKQLEMADTQAENHPQSKGVCLPRHFFNNTNQTSTQRRFGIISILISKSDEPQPKKLSRTGSLHYVMPLAYVAHTTSAPVLSSPSTPSPQPTAQSPNDALMATMTQIANLLSGFQKQFPPTNNQLRTSSNSRTHATVHDGHIVTEPIPAEGSRNFGKYECSRQEGDMLQLQRRRTCC